MTLDLSSLFHTTIGFDDIARILNNFANSEQANTYPPYNISKIDDYTYRISIALAGFETNDIDIILEKDILTIKSSGKKKNISENFLYKGIAFRAFEKKFQLADNIKIKEATLKNGLLNIDLLKILPKEVKKEIINIIEK
jgi:molecular chaperone IbpA|tara:strand:- start:1102 stop:1521 length:420 start_codon:yes stop_codon:yes gene_type:complete